MRPTISAPVYDVYRGDGTEGPARGSAWRTLPLCAAMFLGIIAGCLHQRLPATGPVAIRATMTATLTDGSLLRALLAAPIVFGVVYASLESQPNLFLAAVFAFQNGFCCDVVLNRQIGAGGGPGGTLGAPGVPDGGPGGGLGPAG